MIDQLIGRSIDRLHAHMHVVYAGLCRYAGHEIRRVCVCMMLQVWPSCCHRRCFPCWWPTCWREPPRRCHL